MNHLLTETYGIDTAIQDLQTQLFDKLSTRWNTSEIDGYGRVYRNEKHDSAIHPEVWNATAKKYFEVYYDKKSCFFFIDNQNHTTTDGYQFMADVKIVFMLNLNDIKTSSERVDMDAQRDAIELTRKLSGEYIVRGLEKGVNNVLKGFSVKGLEGNDWQPLHVFAIKGTIGYLLNDKCN